MLDPGHLKIDGKTAPMTVFTVLKPWRAWWTRIVMTIFKLTNPQWNGLQNVKRLRFIHFAQWTVVSPNRFNSLFAGDQVSPVKRHHFLFTTNFNGPWDQYIDSFALVKPVRSGIGIFWGTSQKFTKAYPIRRFKRYIRYHEYPVDAFYNAYPGATIRDIESALEVQRLSLQLENVYREQHGLPPITIPTRIGANLILLGLGEMHIPSQGNLQEAIGEFKDNVTAHLSSTRGHRAPTRKASSGPHGLQL